ncbi:MAG: glycosyltransferase [Hyphomicrobiales bacterium]|nr:glycosyltransferase [Hyphomicrobiales bacterium]
MHFYSLLHLAENERASVNASMGSFDEQVELYARCALTLSRSLKAHGLPYTLLTNDEAALRKSLGADAGDLVIQEMPFRLKAPEGARFYSAHYKLDVFRFFSRLSSAYVVLCDVDMICLADAPRTFGNLAEAELPACYDISDQVLPAYGEERVIQDLSRIHGMASEGRWSGGEFIAGTPAFFGLLSDKTDDLFDRYVSDIESLHHVGDEMVTSAALEALRRGGLHIADAGSTRVVGRYWNADTKHPQRPFAHFLDCFLLHLPADKSFLASYPADAQYSRDAFARTYPRRKTLGVRRFAKQIVACLNALRPRARKPTV